MARAGAAKQYGNLSAITWQNPGLPHDCITLTQRYDLARINKRFAELAPVADCRHPLGPHECLP